MNIGALVPIRLTSERLPNKALLEIAGRPVCYHLFDQVIASSFIKNKSSIVVCTTDHKSDDPLVEIVKKYGCSVFRGHTTDIIDRFYAAMIKFKLDAVIQIDGDDPLSSTEYMDLTMQALLANSELDIVTVEGLPLGCATKSFRRRAVEKVKPFYLTKKNDTGFIYYLTKTGLCNHLLLRCSDPVHQHQTARLTLDYREDYELFKNILEEIKTGDKPLSLREVVTYLTKNPELTRLNNRVDAEYWRRTKRKAVLEYRSPTDQIRTIEV